MNTNMNLPEDPLITMKASPNNYPENQGMGAAVGRHMEEAKGCRCIFCDMGIPVTRSAIVNRNGKMLIVHLEKKPVDGPAQA